MGVGRDRKDRVGNQVPLCIKGTVANPRPRNTAEECYEPLTASSPSTELEEYVVRLLTVRGHRARVLSYSKAGYRCEPTEKQVRDYVSKPFISGLIRKRDIEGLRAEVKAGKGMDAMNKFGETAVHVAARVGDVEVFTFLVEHGGSLTSCDDVGRFPLHEVCWTSPPRFDLVRLILEKARHLLLMKDRRGCTPLGYVNKIDWPAWRDFIDEMADLYWPPVQDGEVPQAERSHV
ncbi:unnamed protein product [Discosporangium mesarthrocarpum]